MMKAGHAAAVLAVVGTMLAFSSPARAQADQAPAGQAPASRVTGENRFFIRFVEDSAIVPSYWLEGKALWQTNTAPVDASTGGGDEADLLAVGPVFAMNVVEDLEFGGRVYFANREPENGGSDTGFTDLDLWGKVSLVSDPVKISLGLLLTLPTGSESKFLGTGETGVEFFGGIRKDLPQITFAGNVGWRVNQDPEFDNTSLEGKNSILAGAGVLVPAGRNLVIIGEWAFETERIDGAKNDSRLLGGAEYRLNESLMLRGAVGGGLSDGAPDFELTGSAVWIF